MLARRGRTRLIQRGRELEILADVVESASAGSPSIVALEGPGGIGKTRLLAEATDQATRARIRVLTARGSEREQRLPFGIVDQLFAGIVDARADPSREGGGLGAPETDSSLATFGRLLEVTERLADDGPLMLAIDDLHLADEPSLGYLSYLARRLAGRPVTIIAALRPFERTPHAALLSALVGDPLAVSVRPGPLTRAATSELLRETLEQDAEPAFASACHEATGGNPLLLSELVKTLRRERVEPVDARVGTVAELGPRAVLRTVVVRLAGLSEAAASLARAVAVLGEAADLPLAAELSRLDADTARTAATTLIAAEILADRPGAAFVHPLVGSAVYEDIPAPERADAHDRAADLLRRRGQTSSAVAAHLVLAPPSGRAWVCDVLLAAAASSSRAGAPVDAVAYLTRALEEPPADAARASILLALGRSTMLIDGPAAEERLLDAVRASTTPESRAIAAMELARLRMFLGRVREGLPLIQEAVADLPPDAGDLRRMLATVELMAPLFDSTVPAPAAAFELGRELPLSPGLGAKMLAAQTSRHWAYEGGSADDCAALALASLEGGDLVRADSVFLSVSATLVLEFADRPEADAAWAALLRECELRGSLHTLASLGLFRGYALARRGELVDAEASLLEALAVREEWNAVQGDVHAAAFLTRLYLDRGDPVAARAALDVILTPEDVSDEARLWLDSQIALLLAEGRHAEALRATEDFERRFAFLGNPLDTPPLLHRALALQGLGRRAAALDAADAAVEQARIWGAPGVVARALRVLGTIQDGDEAIATLERAVATVDGTRASLELLKARVEHGAALRAAARHADARPVLRAALDQAVALDASGLERRAKRELHAAGGRPRKAALSGPASLTESERRVVDLAAEGATNREISEALFVTRKTVELHLSNAYRKLGISGRHELAGAVGERAS